MSLNALRTFNCSVDLYFCGILLNFCTKLKQNKVSSSSSLPFFSLDSAKFILFIVLETSLSNTSD